MNKNSIVLTTFSTVFCIILAIIYNFTISTIKKNELFEYKKLINQIIDPELYNNDILKEFYLIKDPLLGTNSYHKIYIARKNQIPIAIIIESTAPNGYSGLINMLIGTDCSGKIFGVRILNHQETPGFGDKIELRFSNWIICFNGKFLNFDNEKNWKVKKDGGIFDQFTGATITPRAVVNCIKRTLIFLKNKKIKLLITDKNDQTLLKNEDNKKNYN